MEKEIIEIDINEINKAFEKLYVSVYVIDHYKGFRIEVHRKYNINELKAPPKQESKEDGGERKDCQNCKNIATPKGRQCGTLSRKVDEKILVEGEEWLSPANAITFIQVVAKDCNRYEKKPTAPQGKEGEETKCHSFCKCGHILCDHDVYSSEGVGVCIKCYCIEYEPKTPSYDDLTKQKKEKEDG